MPFSRLMNNTVTLIKKDNSSRIPDIKASVQPGKILIDGDHILIEPGDFIEHKMSNGATDIYKVIDPGFHEKFSSIPAGYQMKVEKLGISEQSRFSQHIINYNLSDNARINNSSIDNSLNVVGSQELSNAIMMLRKAIEAEPLQPEQKVSSLELVNAIQRETSCPKPSKVVISALLNTLPQVESIVTITSTIMELLN